MGITFEFRVQELGASALLLGSFAGVEELSRPYDFDLHVTTSADEGDLCPRLLGRAAVLTLRQGDQHRSFHGVIVAASAEGLTRQSGMRRASYRLKFVPRLWLLGLRKNTRIFQGRRVNEIVDEVLAPYHVPTRWALSEELPRREYTTQYDETDLAFLQRITAEQGVFYFFDQPLADFDALGAAIGDAAGTVGAALDAIGEAAPELGRGFGALAREIVVFADRASAYPPIREEGGPSWQDALATVGSMGSMGSMAALPPVPLGTSPELRFFPDTGALHHLHGDKRDEIFTFTRRRSLAPLSASSRDFDPSRPGVSMASRFVASSDEIRELAPGFVELVSALAGDASVPDASLFRTGAELASGVGDAVSAFQQGGQAGSDADSRRGGGPYEVFEHHLGPLFPEWRHEERQPERLLRAARRDADIADGTSAYPFLAPGHRFRLRDHEISSLDGEYALVRVLHEVKPPELGVQDSVYGCRFTCVPAHVPYVPERPARRVVQTCLTAIVEGPTPTDVHTEPGGKVRVRFHWDRLARGGGGDTCWIRVVQPWAGAGFGTQFLPRAGTEVVVAFERGDPDRPLVTGCLYNETNPVPFGLPQHKTRSGLRTRSMPNAEGANELWFDDAASNERVHLGAERDLTVAVKNDRHVSIDHDDRLEVRGDRAERVSGKLELVVAGGRELRIDGGDQTHVEGSRASACTGDTDDVVQGNASRKVVGRLGEEVVGAVARTYRSEAVDHHLGSHVKKVGTAEAKRSDVTHVEGDLRMVSTEHIEISAKQSLVLRCGDSVLRLSPSSIVLSSPEISLQTKGVRVLLTSDALRMKADGQAQIIADKVLLKASGASLGLSSEAAVEGSRVLLNSPSNASDQVDEQSTEKTTIELVDTEGNPLSNHPYRILFDDGREIAGSLDDNGRAELELEAGGRIVFPGLADVAPA